MLEATYVNIKVSSNEFKQVFVYDAMRALDIVLVVILLLPALLLVVVVWILYQVTINDGAPFLYGGLRLGKNKDVFTIYKIRSLIPDAESQIGVKVYNGKKRLELWYGKFIRKTRIDELPQLWNILCGTMTFVGPRPERPNLYVEFLRYIPGYDNRFKVVPGLTGYSQFLTPHDTSKKIRTRIDNLFVCSAPGKSARALFVLWTVANCGYSALRELSIATMQRLRQMWGGCGFLNQRHHRRIRVKIPAVLNICDSSMPTLIVDMSQETLRIRTSQKLPTVNETPKPIIMSMQINVHRKRRKQSNRAICNIELLKERCHGNSFEYVFQWDTASDYHRYLIGKYALKTSAA
jgi:lipopolysaccharide/colanic/teichoic acid biosynthesis glycosyltransferase